MPARRSKYSGGLIRLYGSRGRPASARGAPPRGGAAAVGQVADERVDRVGREREVGLEDRARDAPVLWLTVPARRITRERSAHRRVGDVGPAVRVGAEVRG